MICSSEKRFFTSNLLGVGNWTPNWGATQSWGDVGFFSIPKNVTDECRFGLVAATYIFTSTRLR
ncbi:hypothetical protein FZ025_00685 [Xanthomonas hyacinthi]|nr:hypothetical protein FZ025_00685 [Xanthomonas hyacinthi]